MAEANETLSGRTMLEAWTRAGHGLSQFGHYADIEAVRRMDGKELVAFLLGRFGLPAAEADRLRALSAEEVVAVVADALRRQQQGIAAAGAAFVLPDLF